MMAGRDRAMVMHSTGQGIVAVHVLQFRSVAQDLFLALTLLAHICACLLSNLLKELVIPLTVMDDAHQTLPCLLFQLSIGMLPGPMSLGHIDITSIHVAAGQRYFREGRACHFHVTNGLILKGLITKAANMALVGALRHLGNLRAESFRSQFSQIIVLHPAHREEIPQAGTDVLSLHHGCITAVGAPRGFLAVGRRHGQDLAVSMEVWEHGATFARLHVKDQLLEHLLALHGLQGLG
mmetsp:Transcript_40598/g.50052  ORF Transcript_40598/g.50052 Transcript_40598/m.50052 type:complete len:237 (+) Transcript_40598:287-997(+)